MPIPANPIYNCVRQSPDARDFKAAPPPVSLASLPRKVRFDERPGGLVPPIWSQGSLGSCTGQGGARAHEIVRRLNGYAPRDPSRLFLYYVNRDLEGGDIGDDDGAQIRTTAKAMAKFGVPLESLWPYTPYDAYAWKTRPPQAVYDDAANHQVTKYTSIGKDPRAFCAAIAAGQPVIFGFTVFESFESAEVSETGVLTMPERGEADLGGHCVCATGYEVTEIASPRTGALAGLRNKLCGHPKDDGFLICDNSWGADWGNAGRFTMPFEFLSKHGFDGWTVEAVEA